MFMKTQLYTPQNWMLGMLIHLDYRILCIYYTLNVTQISYNY